MASTIIKEELIMMKRYSIGNNVYWYEEGKQPESAILVETKKDAKAEVKDNAKVEIKVSVPKNKSKGVSAK